jgi:hypothetical protein
MASQGFKEFKKRMEAFPRIEYLSDGKYVELLGHGCATIAEAQRYMQKIPLNGIRLKT